MVFALETQHGKIHEWGVRIEEMLIVHEDRIEMVSNFPVEEITVVDPMPGYSSLRQVVNGLIVPLASREATDAARFGPKAANLARLGHAGLPIPEGFCVDAEAYRLQVESLGLVQTARDVASPDPATARRAALAMKLGLMDRPVDPWILDPLLEAWRRLSEASGASTVVRSSALVEDRPGASFAGQFESYLGLEGETEFLTAVRSCWAALWSTRALRYLATHGSLSPPGEGERTAPPLPWERAGERVPSLPTSPWPSSCNRSSRRAWPGAGSPARPMAKTWW